MLYLLLERVLCQQVFSESKKGVKKLLSVLVIFTPVTRTRKKAVKTTEVAESAGANKDGEESKDKYLKNLA